MQSPAAADAGGVGLLHVNAPAEVVERVYRVGREKEWKRDERKDSVLDHDRKRIHNEMDGGVQMPQLYQRFVRRRHRNAQTMSGGCVSIHDDVL